MLKIDGSHGEGGGQIVRTALALSCILSVPIEIHDIRARREPVGLKPQHVTCIEAAAALCDAEVMGAFPGSDRLVFQPGRAVRAGDYSWKIGTAGSTSLVLQTVLLPLIMAQGESTIQISGGTHVTGSPSAHYLRDVYLPMLVQSGANVVFDIQHYGWYPQGGGEIIVQVEGGKKLRAQKLVERGDLERVFGVALVTNLPAHIPQRMTDRLLKQLQSLSTYLDIRPTLSKGLSTGAGVFITAEYECGRAGFGVLGAKGMPSEEVADAAADALIAFDASGATVDAHLADQLLLILALAEGESEYLIPDVTRHLETNRWVIQQFIDRPIKIDSRKGVVRIAG